MVGVIVGKEYLLQVGKADRRSLQLSLRPFAAVEQEPLAPPANEQRGRAAVRRGHRGGRAEEDDVEVHPGDCRIAAMADPTVLEVYRREVTPEIYRDVRELYKKHSVAEDARDLEGLISTLTPDCVYELVQTGHRWEGHDGARRFYTELLTAFPDIRFDLTDIVLGPQGVCEAADVSATQQAPWLGQPPVEGRLEWKVLIWFPWDPEQRLFRGEKVYTFGIDLPAVAS
jgi:predicted ester cyclase